MLLLPLELCKLTWCRHMDPPVGESVKITNRWNMGTMYICEEVGDNVPADAVVTWKDGDWTFCLRPQNPPLTSPARGNPAIGKGEWHSTFTTVWEIGNQAFCKVKAWDERMQMEGRTIAFVKEKCPDIPVPEVIYEWVDHAWTRTFLITRRVPGERLDLVWPKLSSTQKIGLAKEVAQHAKALSQYTSSFIEMVEGKPITDQGALHSWRMKKTWPSWKPIVHPRHTRETFMKFLLDTSGVEAPDTGDQFFLYHPDMNPVNLFVHPPSNTNEEARLASIIDWEHAAYFPRYWIATMPHVLPTFAENFRPNENAWGHHLYVELEKLGFESEGEWYNNYADSQLQAQLAEDPPEAWK